MTDWLHYEWEFKKRPAIIRVDMQYFELLPILAYQYCLRLSFKPRNPEAEALSHAELRHADALFLHIQEQTRDSAIFVGEIICPNRKYNFLYSENPGLGTALRPLLAAERRLRAKCVQSEEPNYSTFYELLYPDDCRLQSVENEQFLRRLKIKEEERELVHRMNLSFGFGSALLRDMFLEQLPILGFRGLNIFETDNKTHPFCTKITGFSVLTLPGLNRYTTRAIRAASPLSGVLVNMEKVD